MAPPTQGDCGLRQCRGEVGGQGVVLVVVVVVDCGLKVEPLDGSAEATQLSPNHAAQHATPRPVSQSVSQCMQSSDNTSYWVSSRTSRGHPGRAGRGWEMLAGGEYGVRGVRLLCNCTQLQRSET